MTEQINVLQRQLKTEKEESKSLKKRIQVLELEQRRGSTARRQTVAGATPPGSARVKEEIDASIESLSQERDTLKKDLSTAERLAKQATSDVKSKDIQLKRAVETVSRLKEQIADLQIQTKGKSDSGKVPELEARIRELEKQRTEILNAFRKQIKLIDILKRQKIHLEAARLLTFTEEEFMKTLDWNL